MPATTSALVKAMLTREEVNAAIYRGEAVQDGWATGWFNQSDHCQCSRREGVDSFVVPLRRRLRPPLTLGENCVRAWRCRTCGTTSTEVP